jgi:putative Mn2+ efflux pump MntP
MCDGLAFLIGSLIGMHHLHSSLEWGEWLGPVAVAGYGLYVLYLTWRCQDLSKNLGAGRWLVFGLPICLSLDNLVAGMGTEAAGVPVVLVALAFGIVSGGLALLGMGVGCSLAARSRFQAGWVSGILLIVAAGGLFLKEVLLDLTTNS